MQPAVIEQLARAGHICGKPVERRRVCLHEPGHEGACTSAWAEVPKTPVAQERRRRAKSVVQHERAERHVESLTRQLHSAQARIAWMESYPLFRLEYRVRGGYRRVRRYGRFLWHRSLGRHAWKQP